MELKQAVFDELCLNVNAFGRKTNKMEAQQLETREIKVERELNELIEVTLRLEHELGMVIRERS